MGDENTRFSRLGAWVGSLAGAVSAIVALFTAYKIRFDPVVNLTWAVVCLLQAIAIAVLALILMRRKPVTLPRRIQAQNRRLLESLFDSVADDFKAQIVELSRSRLSLYGRQIRNAQVHLLDVLVKENREPRVRATDIIRNLALWPTRGVYLRANENFIRAGGKTRRIFLVRAELINTQADAVALWNIMETHRKMGVEVYLHVLDLLSPEYAEDYVIYSSDCVLVEIEQGDIDFLMGKVTVFFDANSVQNYVKRFKYLFESNDTRSAREIYDLYRRYFIDNSSTPSVEFSQVKAAFLNEAR